MKLERYYLVRRDHRELIGPMALEEFQQRLERMEFGLQDEISGHCGPWIILDRKEDMVKHYPQVAETLSASLSLSWREATGHAKVVSKQDSRRDRRANKPAKRIDPADRQGFDEFIEHQRKKSRRMKAAAIGIILASILLAAFIVSRKEEVPISAEFTALAMKPDPEEFLNVMGLKVIPYPQKYLKTPKHQASWLPLFRMYAFYTTGAIEGVSQKLLRGDQPATAPADCSVEAWKQRWRETASQTVMFVQGKALTKNQWTKILSLDPNWVKRRPSKGWIKPRNYFEGCMVTAAVAFRSLSSDAALTLDAKDGVTPDVVAAISRRLQQQLELLGNGRTAAVSERSGILSSMTCMESALSLAELDLCKITIDGSLRSLMDEKYSLALMKIAASQQQGPIDPKIMSMIPGALAKISSEDQMSRLDITPEYRLMSYFSSGNTVEQSLGKVDQEFGEVKFR